jgi:nitrogen fixation NifU-like protein
MNKLNKMYQSELLRHHQSPIGFNQTINANFQAFDENAFCGDEISIEVNCNNGAIEQIAFKGDSCAICRASASIMCQLLQSSSLKNADTTIINVTNTLKAKGDLQGNLTPLNGIKQYPVRLQCALLPWTTLGSIVQQYNGQIEEIESCKKIG